MWEDLTGSSEGFWTSTEREDAIGVSIYISIGICSQLSFHFVTMYGSLSSSFEINIKIFFLSP